MNLVKQVKKTWHSQCSCIDTMEGLIMYTINLSQEVQIVSSTTEVLDRGWLLSLVLNQIYQLPR